MSAYSFFAKYYDELTQNVEYSRRAEYISGLLLSYGIKEGTVLDLACGTGSLTCEMSKHGYDMIGADMSADMLCIAQNKAYEENQNILFLCQYMQELELYSTVNAAVCSLDSINHVTDKEDIQETFYRLSDYIEKGGVFIFDVNTVYKHRCILGDNTFVYEYPDVFCVWQNSFNEEDNTVDISLDFFEEENGLYKRYSESFTERAYEISELKAMLEEADFEILDIFEELSKSPVKEDTQRAVVIARRI